MNTIKPILAILVLTLTLSLTSCSRSTAQAEEKAKHAEIVSATNAKFDAAAKGTKISNEAERELALAMEAFRFKNALAKITADEAAHPAKPVAKTTAAK